MYAHADEVLRAGSDIAIHQRFRIELLRLPQRDDVLVTELGWMSVMLHMMGIVRMPGDIHEARVPVARTRDGLRPPVRPDTELGVAEPPRRLVSLQRFHTWLK